MLYDVGPAGKKQNIDGDNLRHTYTRKTDEDWNDIVLSLSTGSPVNAISPPSL
jgi:hypothetical protein